jgi:hypothetical protein
VTDLARFMAAPKPQRAVIKALGVYVGDIPGVAAIYGHRECFVKSSHNQSDAYGPILALKEPDWVTE